MLDSGDDGNGPGGRSGFGMASVGADIYVFGGYDYGECFQVYLERSCRYGMIFNNLRVGGSREDGRTGLC